MKYFMVIGVLLVVALPTQAKFKRKKKSPSVILSLSADYYLSSSAADNVSGASYTRQFKTGIVPSAGLGLVLGKVWYVGLRYDYWLAGRTMTSPSQTDTLKFQTLGAELGIVRTRDRLGLMILGGIAYPLSLSVDSTAGNFTTTEKPLGYYGKAVVSIHFSRYHAFFLQGGYRLANLGNLTSGGTPFLAGGADFDLSGLFGGLGLFFEF